MDRAVNPADSGRTRLVVELAGPAGSGKTALAAALMQSDAAIGPGRVDIPLARFAAAAWPLLPTLAQLRGVPIGVLRKDAKRMIYLSALARAVTGARRRSTFRTLLFDEGAVYMLARMETLHGQVPMPEALRQWRQRSIAWWATHLDVLVLLDAPNAVLLQRIHHRAQTLPLDAPDDALGVFLSQYRAAYDRIARAFESSGRVRILRLATHPATPQAIVERVRALLGSAAAAA